MGEFNRFAALCSACGGMHPIIFHQLSFSYATTFSREQITFGQGLTSSSKSKLVVYAIYHKYPSSAPLIEIPFMLSKSKSRCFTFFSSSFSAQEFILHLLSPQFSSHTNRKILASYNGRTTSLSGSPPSSHTSQAAL
jgi:hypothetical protein